jgi:hypothetical protein
MVEKWLKRPPCSSRITPPLAWFRMRCLACLLRSGCRKEPTTQHKNPKASAARTKKPGLGSRKAQPNRHEKTAGTGYCPLCCRCASVRSCFAITTNEEEGSMRKLALTLTAAALVLGTLAVTANAQTQSPGAANLHAQMQNATPITKAACGGFGPYCPPGTTRVCGPYRCWCRRCY